MIRTLRGDDRGPLQGACQRWPLPSEFRKMVPRQIAQGLVAFGTTISCCAWQLSAAGSPQRRLELQTESCVGIASRNYLGDLILHGHEFSIDGTESRYPT